MTVFSVLLKLLVMFVGVFFFFAAVHSFSDRWLYNNMIGKSRPRPSLLGLVAGLGKSACPKLR